MGPISTACRARHQPNLQSNSRSSPPTRCSAYAASLLQHAVPLFQAGGPQGLCGRTPAACGSSQQCEGPGLQGEALGRAEDDGQEPPRRLAPTLARAPPQPARRTIECSESPGVPHQAGKRPPRAEAGKQPPPPPRLRRARPASPARYPIPPVPDRSPLWTRRLGQSAPARFPPMTTCSTAPTLRAST